MVMMNSNPRNRMILTNGITAYEASGDKTIYFEDLNLPMRIYNPLRVAGYKTAAQINAVRNRDGLRRLSRMGEKSIDDIVLALKKCGFEAQHLECK
jgi:DNA-directed RNA polymerase alpha subunit